MKFANNLPTGRSAARSAPGRPALPNGPHIVPFASGIADAHGHAHAPGRRRPGSSRRRPLDEAVELLDSELEWVVGGLERAWPTHGDVSDPAVR